MFCGNQSMSDEKLHFSLPQYVLQLQVNSWNSTTFKLIQDASVIIIVPIPNILQLCTSYRENSEIAIETNQRA